jgi:hypothetical protein
MNAKYFVFVYGGCVQAVIARDGNWTENEVIVIDQDSDNICPACDCDYTTALAPDSLCPNCGLNLNAGYKETVSKWIEINEAAQ